MRWNGESRCEYDGKSMESKTNTCYEFPDGGKAIVEQILASQEINKSKRAGLWDQQSGMRVGKLTIWVRSFEIEKLQQSSADLSVPPEKVSQSLWWALKSPKINTLTEGLIERTWSMLDEIGSKTVHNNKEGDRERKKKWDIEWSKTFENISKSLQSFLEISPVQKEVLSSRKLGGHPYEYCNPFGLREDSLSKWICQNRWSHPGLSHREQKCRQSLFKERFTITKVRRKASTIRKVKL